MTMEETMPIVFAVLLALVVGTYVGTWTREKPCRCKCGKGEV